jgi:hypothetical protein
LSLEGYVPKAEVADTQTGDDERLSAKFDFCTECRTSNPSVSATYLGYVFVLPLHFLLISRLPTSFHTCHEGLGQTAVDNRTLSHHLLVPTPSAFARKSPEDSQPQKRVIKASRMSGRGNRPSPLTTQLPWDEDRRARRVARSKGKSINAWLRGIVLQAIASEQLSEPSSIDSRTPDQFAMPAVSQLSNALRPSPPNTSAPNHPSPRPMFSQSLDRKGLRQRFPGLR